MDKDYNSVVNSNIPKNFQDGCPILARLWINAWVAMPILVVVQMCTRRIGRLLFPTAVFTEALRTRGGSRVSGEGNKPACPKVMRDLLEQFYTK